MRRRIASFGLASRALVAVLALAAPSWLLAQAPKYEHPISAVVRAPAGGYVARPGERIDLTVAATIPSTPVVWHLYSITQPPGGPIRTTIGLHPRNEFRLAGEIRGTPPTIADDPNFGIKTETYADSAVFTVPVVVSPTVRGDRQLRVTLRYQACNDRYCLPPVTDTLVATVRVEGSAALTALWDSVVAAAPAASEPEADASVPPLSDSLPGNGSLALFLWIAATMGALSLLTPCVFPMVPITISYFSRGEARGRGRAMRDATVYAVGIIAAFTAIGLGLALFLGATGLNRFAANPWLNIAIAILFAGFALSLFGVVNLGVPGTFVNRIDALTRSSRLGRDGTTLLMGATFAVTTFTCTAPFVGTLLVSATQGDWLWPALGLLVFASVFAIPFVILALVPEGLTRLPRSGEWMITIKVVLGFLEMAAAIKFLSNADLVEGWGIFTRQVVLGTWIVLGLGLVAYLLGIRPRRMVPVTRHPVGALLTMAVIAWLATGLAGRRLGELEPFLPPAGHDAGGVANPGELAWMLDDYEGALDQGKKENKLVLVDFTGYTCTNCRWMEANMFPREEVEREMEKFIRVRLFTDGRAAKHAAQQKLQAEKFGTVALPLYAIVDGDGRSHATFLGMTRDAEEFLTFLRMMPASR